MQIQVFEDNKILAVDSAGNLKKIEFSHKIFMEKIIKTQINLK